MVSIPSLRVELHTSQTEINKLRTERKSAENKLIQQQKDFEKQLGRQKETCTKLERTVEKLNKQLNDYKYQQQQQQQIMKERYLDSQRRTHANENDKTSKGNSLSSMHKKHHVFQDSVTTNSNYGKTANSQVENDERDVIFF